MSKLRQALNYLQILKEATKLPLTNPTLILSITLFILLPFNLLQLFVAAAAAFDLPPPLEIIKTSQGKTILQVELVRDTLQWLTNTLAISMLSKAYIEKPCSMLELLHACTPKQCYKVFATSLLGEIITFSSSTLLLFIGHPLIETNFKDANLARFVGVVVVFGVCMCVYLACELGVVVASVEEGCFGISAIGKGVEIIRGRKVQSFGLMGLMFVVDGLVGGGVRVGLQLFWCSVCCVLYLESRKRVGIKDEDEERWIV